MLKDQRWSDTQKNKSKEYLFTLCSLLFALSSLLFYLYLLAIVAQLYACGKSLRCGGV